jgi:hypothetical protein
LITVVMPAPDVVITDSRVRAPKGVMASEVDAQY